MDTATEYGRLVIAPREALFAHVVALAEAQRQRRASRHFTWALSGGQTPQDWCRWAAQPGALDSLRAVLDGPVGAAAAPKKLGRLDGPVRAWLASTPGAP